MEAARIVRAIRGELWIQRAQLARLADVSPSTIGRIEKGELDPSCGVLSRILDASGFQIDGEGVRPTGDTSAFIAARRVLDVFLSGALGSRGELWAQDGWADEQLQALDGPEDQHRWWERWRRAGWLSDHPLAFDVRTMIRAAARISAPGRLSTPGLVVDVGRRWRDLALRIDEAGLDYAVSELAPGLEHPGSGLARIPRIYVSDPGAVASVLRLREATPGTGVPLVTTHGIELEAVHEGCAIRFTSPAQAIMDALVDGDDGGETGNASRLLHSLLLDVLRYTPRRDKAARAARAARAAQTARAARVARTARKQNAALP